MKKHVIKQIPIRRGLVVNLLDPEYINDDAVTYVAVFKLNKKGKNLL